MAIEDVITRQEFKELVARLEEFSQREPAAYKMRVGLLAALGLTYVLVICSILLVLTGIILMATIKHPNYATIKGLLIVGGLTLAILRSMWVSMTPPEGIRLDRAKVPKLFKLIGEISRELNCKPFHEVLLVDDFNASVWQVPRLGLLGWHKNYLVLGLPLMQALTPEQFKAVMAHEFAHLSGGHGRFGNWIYRVRKTWYELMARLEQEKRWGSFLFTRFFSWYAPFFNAYSFVYARANEYEADHCAARLGGVQHSGEALIQVNLKGRLLSEKVWPELFKQANSRPEPPDGSLHAATALRGSIPPDWQSRWYRQALLAPTGTDDTHPGLADRLRNIGFQPATEVSAISKSDSTAADEYLGLQVETYLATLNDEWKEGIAPAWKARFTGVQEELKGLESLDTKAAMSQLTPEEEWNRVRMTVELRGDDAARPLCEKFLERHPNHPHANFVLGEILLKQNDESGIARLERAMAVDRHAFLPGNDLIQDYLRGHGKGEEAKRLADQADEYYEKLVLSEQERSQVTSRDDFIPQTLSENMLNDVREKLTGHREIGEAYLARKVVEHFPDQPFYVLGIVVKVPFFSMRSGDADQKLLQNLLNDLQLPISMYVIILDRATKGVHKKLKKMDGARFYARN